jgi:hypothetical protein
MRFDPSGLTRTLRTSSSRAERSSVVPCGSLAGLSGLRFRAWGEPTQRIYVSGLASERPIRLFRRSPRLARRARTVGGSERFDLDLDLDARREIQALERVDGLGGVLDDVDETLVDPHLEVLAGVLVLVG